MCLQICESGSPQSVALLCVAIGFSFGGGSGWGEKVLHFKNISYMAESINWISEGFRILI